MLLALSSRYTHQGGVTRRSQKKGHGTFSVPKRSTASFKLLQRAKVTYAVQDLPRAFLCFNYFKFLI